jgi:hypothetical protein
MRTNVVRLLTSHTAARSNNARGFSSEHHTRAARNSRSSSFTLGEVLVAVFVSGVPRMC